MLYILPVEVKNILIFVKVAKIGTMHIMALAEII